MATRYSRRIRLCQSCDTASGAWDARHVVNGNAVYQLPFGLGKPMLNQRGIASAIAGNWELTTTALARTGFPVNVLMPAATSRRMATRPARSVPTWLPASADSAGRQNGCGVVQSRGI